MRIGGSIDRLFGAPLDLLEPAGDVLVQHPRADGEEWLVRSREPGADAMLALRSDDVNVAIEDGQPIGMVLPEKGGLGVPMMPNMVSLIAHAPRPDEGRQLIDYLLSKEVERQLAQSAAVQIPLHAGVPGPKNIRRSTASSR